METSARKPAVSTSGAFAPIRRHVAPSAAGSRSLKWFSPRPQGPARQQTAARHYDGLSDDFPDVHRRRLKGAGARRAFRLVTNC